MSSNVLYGLRKVGTFVQLTGLFGRPVHQPVFAGCMRRLCDRRLWLVTKSALKVYVVHDQALYKLTIFTFTFTSFTFLTFTFIVRSNAIMVKLNLHFTFALHSTPHHSTPLVQLLVGVVRYKAFCGSCAVHICCIGRGRV